MRTSREGTENRQARPSAAGPPHLKDSSAARVSRALDWDRGDAACHATPRHVMQKLPLQAKGMATPPFPGPVQALKILNARDKCCPPASSVKFFKRVRCLTRRRSLSRTKSVSRAHIWSDWSKFGHVGVGHNRPRSVGRSKTGNPPPPPTNPPWNAPQLNSTCSSTSPFYCHFGISENTLTTYVNFWISLLTYDTLII